ncbi:hypothetical protein [Rodentibacter haemolyticus]|uniref:DUF5405 domain-containing protein n=1 Tax=Rodentibacter haemolyticus TaxID=2778911 RepID=A0ABX6V0H8_9PAST|nr:hypothetical protein [Rodentibacter haemolyticus]QPB43050.1 hypothetical protein IHV77_02730 [Rodentibacter haemolyticus]
MQEHIIDLTNRYCLKLSNGKYVLYEIDLKDNGTYERTGGKVCNDLFSAFNSVTYCELNQEEVTNITEVIKRLEAIQAEIKRIAEIQQAYA